MTKYITIDLCRISPNGDYLDLIFNCDLDYQFTRILVTVRYYDLSKNSDLIVREFDLTDSLKLGENTTKKNWSTRIPINIFEIPEHSAAVYTITFVYQSEDGEEVQLIDLAWVSDVTPVYNSLIDGILNINSCEAIPDDVIRLYMALYAHQMAINLHNFDEALEYLRILSKGFNLCNSCGHIELRHRVGSNSSCNCRK